MAHSVVNLILAAIMLSGCSRTSLELQCQDAFGQHVLPQCEPAIADVPEAVLPEEIALDVLTAGCEFVALLANEPSPTLRVSIDGGMTFGPAQSLPPNALLPDLGVPRHEPIAMAEDGTLHVLAQAPVTAENAGALQLHRSPDFGATWSAPVDIPQPPADNSWGSSILVRGDEVYVTWVDVQQLAPGTSRLGTTWLARSQDGGHSFEPTIRVAKGQSSHPQLCAAGEHGMVGAWLGCTGIDCSGEDRNGISQGMISISEGGQFSNHELFQLDNGVHGPVAGCFANGRALVTWSAAAYLGSNRDIVVASVLPCGVTMETARFVGGTHWLFRPRSPTPVLGPNGALLFWQLEFGGGSGVAMVDSEGKLISVALDPDYDTNGAYDLPLGACAFPNGGYALLTVGNDPFGGPTNAVATFLTDDGKPAFVRVLGPLDESPGPAWVRCDNRGRAHFFWTRGGHARHMAIATTF